ncbi:uncharacterized protein YecE (DUF72 family) [Nocardia tenerifensis]|uniref:Uncharacterized protein YecE (DUF72 family) n=1 Tax=Nocardia tenerifensis TaxID=228006 RepID=A0A318KCC9_9NOCA|nr:DUF72 domain-containing protein [Nocardia tenerifensis]PXX68699.1 uncharacterized protein YecE (DUF72 family) [Nocardia tenerifensis]
MGEIRIGTSGWVYPPWRGVFYPKGVTQKRELEYLSRQLNSVEINGSFYSLQRPSSYQNWASQTPDDFVFAVKGSRFITHMKRLRDGDELLANFLASGLLALGPKLGPVLWQLPPNFQFDPDLLDDFFTRLPRDTEAAADVAKRHDHRVDPSYTSTDAVRPLRHALEIRHPSFVTPEFTDLLTKHEIALVVADTAGKFPLLEEVTADFVYIRLHGHEELYVSGYTDEGLDMWAAKIRGWSTDHDVYCYFDNDAKVMAPRDALALRARLEHTP